MARASSRTVEHNTWNEIPALLFLGAGTLLFLALVSYTPDDLPASSFWAPFSRTATPNLRPENVIGIAGAVTAGWFYFLLGAGSYLVAATLLFFGAAKMLFPGWRLGARAAWAGVCVAAGSSLAEWQPWFLHDWHARFNLVGHAGGWLGMVLDKLFFTLLGSAGAPIALSVIYLCSLVLMTGLHPLTQLRLGVDSLQRAARAWRRRSEEARAARATAKERLDMDLQRIAKETRRLEKQVRKGGGAPLTAAETGEFDFGPPIGAEDEFAHLPPPKITDNSAPPPIPVKKKPSLAEVLGRSAQKPAGDSELGEANANGGDLRFANYQLPDTDLLDTREVQDFQAANEKELKLIQFKIVETLEQFGIKVVEGDITKGPTITRYEVYPAKGVRVDRIVSLEKDLARATRAERINILAPIPGKDTVGIEIANSKKVKVTLRELLEGADWLETKARIPIALGKDVYGKTIIADLAAMPHCLIAGATGSGKSVCINTIIASLLYRFTPEDLRLIMIDPKVVELQMYNDLPHLVVPVVTDPKKVLLALRWIIDEMMKRYDIFAKSGVRNITGFNGRPKPKSQAELDAEEARMAPASVEVESDSPVDEEITLQVNAGGTTGAPPARNLRDHMIIPDRLPYIVVIIDELADLMQTAPADVESAIARITQMARAAGIHLIVATQTPRADVVTGVIKANIPSRIAFQVAGALDSRVILDENGAERLLGQGDMLYRPPGTSRLIRAQGVFVTDEEVHRLVEFTGKQGAPAFEAAIHDKLEGSSGLDEDISEEDEELVQKCIEIIRQEKKCSTSMLQRRLRLGYTRAARIVDILEQRGIVGPENGAKGREILVDLDQSL